MNRIAIIGTFDSKEKEFAYLRQSILERECLTYTIDVGVLPSKSSFPIDYRANTVETIESLSRDGHDRNFILSRIVNDLSKAIWHIFTDNKIDGVIGMGGGSGSAVIAEVMRTLPVGFPKVLVTTCAGISAQVYIGSSDIIVVPAIVDISGINSITRRLFQSAASIVCGLARSLEKPIPYRRRVALTMLGNTTPCCNFCREMLESSGFEVIVFHANGIGGRVLEELLFREPFDGVIDLTTTELVNHQFGGLFDAGPGRLMAAAKRGIPIIIAPGGVDFFVIRNDPKELRAYSNRKRVIWTSDLVLVRTSLEENRIIARTFGERIHNIHGPLAVVLPSKGFSLMGQPGGCFHSVDCDTTFISTLAELIESHCDLQIVECVINSKEFANVVVKTFLRIVNGANIEPAKSGLKRIPKTGPEAQAR